MEIIDQIDEDIVFGVYPLGSRIIEDSLQKRFGLSRYVLRSMLTELETRGLVMRIPNRGVVVVEPTPDEIDGLYEIRELLEVRAAETTPLPPNPEEMARLEELVDQHAKAAEAGDLRRVFRLNIELHEEQYSICPNPMLRQAIQEYSRRVHIVRAVSYDETGHIHRVIGQHKEILAAMRAGDHSRYIAAVRAHLPDSRKRYRRVWEVKHGAYSPQKMDEMAGNQ